MISLLQLITKKYLNNSFFEDLYHTKNYPSKGIVFFNWIILNKVFKKISALFFFLSLLSCNKEALADLNIEYTEGEQGFISITASANKAVLYRFSFGNSEVIENTEGSIEYQYSNNGTYTIGIWSFYDENLNSFNYETLEVTITNALGDEIKQIDESLIDTSEETTLYTGYQLVWNDEFNYEGPPATEKWHHQYIPIFGGGWANNEKQHYTARIDNSYVSEGTLKITAKKENYTYEGSLKNFTSARLNSKFSLLYGRIDVRAKLPASKGTWPAIWTLGTNSGERGNYFGTVDGNVGWPECGEIDIMEQNGENKQILYGTFHWADGGGQPASYGLTKDVSSLDISDVTSEFHLYSLVWNTASIKLLVDNLLIAEIANTASVPFDNPHYLILNIAMGGTLGGTIPGNFEQDSMEIDFVRFYQ